MARFDDTNRSDSLSSKFRAQRDIRLKQLITDIAAPKGSIRILDLGGSVEYWTRIGRPFLRDVGARITVLNYAETELKAQAGDEDLFETRVGDACDLSAFADGSFDLVHSNSVIEHVGNWSRMKQFAAETRRVGTSYYVQTPYFWFPVDPHYYRAPMIHWMPRPVRASLLCHFPIAYAGRIRDRDSAFEVLDSTQLIDRRQFAFAFPDASIFPERVLGLTKSLIAVRHESAA